MRTRVILGRSLRTTANSTGVAMALRKRFDQPRDETIRGTVTRSFAMRERLTAFKKEIRDELPAHIELSFERFGRRYRLIFAVDKVLYFNERLQVAKGLIDERITRR